MPQSLFTKLEKAQDQFDISKKAGNTAADEYISTLRSDLKFLERMVTHYTKQQQKQEKPSEIPAEITEVTSEFFKWFVDHVDDMQRKRLHPSQIKWNTYLFD